MAKSLESRVAIVTGASSGIGQAAARRLHAHGARLVLNARRGELLESLAAETGGVPVVGDVTDPAVRERILEACGERVDVLVNNAGFAQPGPVETVPGDDYRRQFEVNVFALGAMAAAVLPAMRSQRSGRIVNISSVAGRFGYPLFGWYCASKHAVEGLSDAMRIEAAPFGVQVVPKEVWTHPTFSNRRFHEGKFSASVPRHSMSIENMLKRMEPSPAVFKLLWLIRPTLSKRSRS